MKPIQQFAKAIPLTVLVFTAQMLVADKSWAQNERCGGFQSISLTDWEAGLGAWTVGTYDLAQPGAFDTPDWAAVGGLPDGRTGMAAFAANLDVGACPGDDQSGVLTLTSPTIDIPAETDTLKIALNHWFDIEYGWDGGNLKISVNEGPFTLVPGSAFETGPYTDVLFEAIRDFEPYNSNPLAEQAAFTGPGLDLEGGSWGVSRVNLAGIAAAGDSIQLRFDFGIDECFGAVGWYVDEVEVYSCEEASGARLTLVKDVINDNGGTATASNWTLTASGPTGFSGSGPFVTSGTDFMAGRYDLSESGGPAGYTASDWFCDGGTQNDADTITLGQGESATCTITNDDVISGFQINAGHSGAWFNPATSGQGLLLDVEPAEQYMFIAWFTYTDAASDNPFEQRWLTAQGNYSGNTAVLDLFETLGGKFDDPQAVTTTKIGEVTVSFSDCGHGQATYSFDEEDLQGEFPLERAIPGSGNTCDELEGSSTQAVDINAGMDGAWFDPATSGQGYLVDSYPNPDGSNFIFVAWFTFGEDTASGQRWFTAQGGFAGSLAELDVYESTGGSFDDPLAPATDLVGTMSIDFTDCSNAILAYVLPDDSAEGVVSIQRAVPGAEALCEELAGAQ